MANSAIHPSGIDKWVVIHVIRYMDYGAKAQRGWLGRGMSGCITAGPKSVVQAMGAASLRRSTIANASQLPFQGCKALLRIIKRRYIKYHDFAFFD